MSLIPCKYFARNECRFGDNCRFYHARGGNVSVNPVANVFGGGSHANQNFNRGGQQQDVLNLAAKSHQNMDAMAEIVKKDMIEWDMGKIWPFSTYGPAGNKPSVPGFEDISFEELRYRFLQNNKMPIDLSQELRNVHQCRQNYQQLTPTIRNILERIIVKGERVSDVNPVSSEPQWGGSSVLSISKTPNVFGGGTVFGAGSSSASSFQGATASVFGTTATSPFGAAAGNTGNMPGQTTLGGIESMEGSLQQQQGLFSQSQQNSTGLFGGQNKPVGQFGTLSQSPFGGTSQQSNVFQTSQPQQSSVFGQPQQNQSFPQQASSGVFQTQNSFQPSQLQSLLQTNSQQQPQTNLFQTTQPQSQFMTQNPNQQQLSTQQSQTSSGSIFGGGFSQPSTAQSIFGAPPNQSALSATVTPASQSIFGAPPNQSALSATMTPPATQSIFGAPPNQSALSATMAPPGTQSIFGAPPNQSSLSPTVTSPATQSIFGAQPSQVQPAASSAPTQSIFGTSNQVQPTATVAPAQSIFGVPPNQASSSIFGQPGSTVDQKYVYSDESDLTQEELDAFRADFFTIENIPIKPPPKALCRM